MNKEQLKQVLGYIDAEYAGIVARMTDAEKIARAKHWMTEIGSLDYDAVMTAVRKLSRGQYMPRTAEIRSEVEQIGKISMKTGPGTKCRIYRDPSGEEVLDLRYRDGSEWMTGYLRYFPEWMQLQFRWMADPSPENTAAWDAYIFAHEERDAEMFPKADALMTMAGGAA